MTLQTSLKTFLAGSALAAVLATGAQAQELRGWNIHVEDYPVSIAMESFMAEVTEKNRWRCDWQNLSQRRFGQPAGRD